MQLASGLLLKIEQVLRQIGIKRTGSNIAITQTDSGTQKEEHDNHVR